MKRTAYILALLLALAVLVGLRLPFLRCEPFIPGAPLLFDEKDYLHGARSFAAGDTTNDTAEAWMRAPATAWLLLQLGQLRHVPPELAVCDFQRVQIGMWAAILLLVAAIAAMLFDRRAALISAVLVALLPVGVSVTLMVHADTLFCLALVATVWALLLYARRGRAAWLLFAGICAGAGILTRSPLLPLLPLLALWVAFESWRPVELHQPIIQRARGLLAALRSSPRLALRVLLPALLFLAVVAAMIAPWTIRNERLYGGFIPSDTTGGIILLRNNAPGLGIDFAAIRAVSPNPAERQRYATRRALEVIRADPGRFIRKFAYTSLLAWGPDKFVDTRDFLTASTEQPRIASLFAQLTMLLWLAIPLFALGLLRAPANAPGARSYRAVMLLFALVYTAMMGVTHFEERYRLPFLLLWLPYAGWCLAHPRALLGGLHHRGHREHGVSVASPSSLHGSHLPISPSPHLRVLRALRGSFLLRSMSGLIGIALIAVAAWFYMPLWYPAQPDDARALLLHTSGLVRARLGDLDGALADQQAAAAIEPQLREARLAAAQLLAQAGRAADAETSLRATLSDARLFSQRAPADATVALQQLLRAQNRIAESAALDTTLAPAVRRRAEALAWGHGAPVTSTLTLAADDLGRVSGFYPASADQPFRWSAGQARMLLQGSGQYACLRANANRPPELPAPIVTLQARVNGGATQTLAQLHPPRQGWAWLCAPLTAAVQDAQLELDIQTPTYNPFALRHAVDARDLGIALSDAVLLAGPLLLDQATGLLLEQPALASAPNPTLELIGRSGATRGTAGDTLTISLWWRATQPPAQGVFTFLHLLDASGQKVAEYNAPLAGDVRPQPWVAGEPLLDQTALALPAGLPPGRYHLIAGAFDPASNTRLTEADLGELVVE